MRACIAILPLLCACTELNLDHQSTDTSTHTDSGTISDTSAGTDSQQPATTEPAWFALDGKLQITGGVAVPTGSSITLTYEPATDAPASADTATLAALPCTRTPMVTAITAEDAPDAAVGLGWWSFTLAASDEATCPWALPADLHLGIGDLDPALDAAMELAGLQVDGSQLDGLYVQYSSDPLWVFGVAGTDAQFAGSTTGSATDTAAPPSLPDGLYTLQGLHLLPYAAN